jgi:hypothetical protein
MNRFARTLATLGLLFLIAAFVCWFLGAKDQAGHIQWWWYAILCIGALLVLTGGQILAACDTDPREIRFMPKGPIVTLKRSEVAGVNEYLAKKAACPACRSRNVLWYQYNRKALEPDAAVYIRCQDCGHDDYTQL